MLKTFIRLLITIVFITLFFNIKSAFASNPATLTRYSIGGIQLMVLEWSGIGQQLSLNWRGNHTFYHNDEPTEYSIVRSVEAAYATAAINLDGQDVQIVESVVLPTCLLYNFDNGEEVIYRSLVATGGNVAISYGDETFTYGPGQIVFQLDRNFYSILEVSVNGVTQDCDLAVNEELINYDYQLFVPIVSSH
jgi:hypothetical protein